MLPRPRAEVCYTLAMNTKLTPFSDVNALVDLLLAEIRPVLGPKLVGLYLSGSLATGGFRPEVSDIDLVAATSAELDEREFADLKAMHEQIARSSRQWGDRIDVAYVSVAALRGCVPAYRYPAIFGGDPLHWKEAGADLVITRHVLPTKGIAVCGPASNTLLDPVSRDDLVRSVQQACRGEWRGFIADIRTRNEQAFWILLLCRALYTVREGDVVSKPAAALWTQQALPGWSSVIRRALTWWQDADRWRNGGVAGEATLPQTRRFVRFAIEQIGRDHV
jgi:predicted nucleotidyltransferase